MNIAEQKTITSQYYEAYEGSKQSTAKPRHYLELYEKYFGNLTDKELSILELGIFEGHSLEYFSRLFPNSRVFGVDINKRKRTFSNDRVTMYQGAQQDPALYQRIMAENGITQFDVIIDDCSHIGSLTLDSFNILYPFLTPGGLYIIEDWGTGYWEKWPDGRKFEIQNHLQRTGMVAGEHYTRFKNHNYGMPGIIKQLVDEVAMRDIACVHGLHIEASPKIEYLHIYPGIVFMRKVQN